MPPQGAWIEKVIAEERARAEALEAEGTPPHPAMAGVIIDDNFADGDRAGGSDEFDGVWWTTSASAAIDIAPGELGLVSGGAGRGIEQPIARKHCHQAKFCKRISRSKHLIQSG